MEKIIFWKDPEARTVDPTLFSSKAENLAKILASDHKSSKLKFNRRTQIRHFYDEILRLNNEAQTTPERWEIVLPRVHMLIAKAAYARGRDLVSDNFLGYMRSSVDQIHTVQDLSIWANFFEALMGFYALYVPRN